MKKTTAERDPEAALKLRDLIQDISVAMLTTVTQDGTLRSRPMATQQMHVEGELWFFTADDSGKTRDLAEEHAVNVSYSDPTRQRYVSVSGSASLVRDNEKVHELWKKELERFFPGGLDDPHLTLLRVKIETAEYWDAKARKMHRLAHDGGGPDQAPDELGEHTRVEIRATPASG